ncbi:FAD-dependent oxidoreductase [Liquorilactobacillus uvarum]|uniref:Urocanate reductase n=1 Tax=Liquorilactobacillus uvarum DSM 19971 TaxID=1423812 RepID=A0A0R1Q6H7_9LACO|nr:FAD-dependent oxidoreductase [Liquorilactobacillus uvarum]KRL37941.1 fumarate reductase succinate dehydrogenase flavoprotein domain-containing protein [Liquorilactobacillus uvarum DSM 19971]
MSELKSGKYRVIAKEYEGETIPLEIEIENNKIIKITPQKKMIPGGLEETVFTHLPKQIIENQTLEVDAISGASHSRQGLLDAVQETVLQAGGDINSFHNFQTSKNTAEKLNTLKPDVDIREDAYSIWRKIPENVSKEINTDFLIIGAGISGLAAAVQAGLDGMNTLVIEKNSFVAGNGGGVEGIFGINTKMQKSAGIHVQKEKIIAKEAEMGQYRVDGSFWVDLVNNSADNIDWLVKQGVQLSKVDDYHGTCMFPTFHWYKGGFASEGYVPFMKKRADELGVNFLLGTSAKSVIFDENRVKGVYAQTAEGIIKINAKATLLATGGVGHNPELIEKQGWPTKNLHYCSMPSNTGDGYQIAMSLRAKDMLRESPEFMMNYIQALPHEGVHLYIDPINGFMSLPSGGPVVWINQNGKRFVNENVKKYNLLYQRMAIGATKVTYQIFTQKIYDEITKNVSNAKAVLAEAVEKNEGKSLYKSATIEELAQKIDVPKKNLVATIKKYNKFAHNGRDEEFAKEAEMIIPIEEGPFYIARLDPSNLIGIGGVGSNQKFEVIDDDFERINGLYISGMDSAMQYRNVYTITLGGSACAHNVNSGRHASINAKSYIETL